jgi:hypothetical protein
VHRAAVQPLAHRRLRRRHDDALQVQALGDRDLVQQGGRDDVDRGEAGEVGEVVLVGREVVDGVDPTQEVGEQVAVPHVSDPQLRARGQVVGLAVAVNRGGEGVQDDDLVSELREPVAGV